MRMTLCLLIAATVMVFAMDAGAETVVLRSGQTVDGDIIRTDASNVTIRTSDGVSSYRREELDPDWAHIHFKEYHRERREELGGAVSRLMHGIFGEEAMAELHPFLMEHRKVMLPVSAVLLVMGLLLCFFGWKLFKFGTILGGILSGIMLGLVLASVIAQLIVKAVPEDTAKVVGTIAFLAIGIPFAVVGGKFGRRFAMFGARVGVLDGIGSGGLMGVLFSLTQFAFFDLSIIWGHALFGAILFIGGAYCAAVPLLCIPADSSRITIIVTGALGVLLCVFGAVTQIRNLRSEPKAGYRGEY